MVTVFVFMTYPDNTFVQALGVMSAMIDATYIVVLTRRLRRLKVDTTEVAEARAPALT
jgi:hypothetical protein